MWVASLYETGLTRSQIADAMGFDDDTLRREKPIVRGLAYLGDLDSDRHGHVLLPRIWAGGEEGPPSLDWPAKRS
jgi:hypothetical protein